MTEEITSAQSQRMCIDLTAYTAYFEKLASDFKLLNGFYELDMQLWDKFESDLRGGHVPSPCLILEDLAIMPIAGGSASSQQEIEGALAVLAHYDVRNKPVPTTFFNHILYIINQVRAKMIVDKSNACNLMKNLKPISMRIERTERLHSYVGFRMPFKLIVEDRFELDRDEWEYLPFEE